MIFHLRIDDGVLVPRDAVVEWANQFIDDYFDMASVLEEGMHDVTPISFEGGPNRHRLHVLPEGTAVYGVYQGEELQEPILHTSEPGQKTAVVSASSPTFLISRKTRTPEAIFVLCVIFYRPDLVDFQPDLSLISKN